MALILDAHLRRSLLVVDGELVDGGSEQQYGQGGIGYAQPPTDQPAEVIATGRVHGLRIFDRALSVSDAVLLTR